MTFAAKLASVGSVATGAVGTGVGGAYYSSLETIEGKLKGKILGNYDTFKSAWDDKQQKLNGDNGTLSEDLKKIKEAKDGTDLSLYCHKNYSSTYRSIFSSKENTSLLEETKKWCTQTFKDQLGVGLKSSGKVLKVDSDSEDKENFKENFKKLKTHDEKTEGPLTEKLRSLSPSADTSSEQNWQQLQSYCKEAQSKYLTVETLEDFKVAKKYCVKET
ncbi:hypothetical protein HF1_01990 [Mycoplasma haemofelis str. Langford 1]|uniref:Uncharacterized protein n=1 Tax=Mycoplasma haemofelis (strain Langford 1) TaxID=941640 RepID=E8ZKP1_MYCHL|nr:hypothetical protein [Mycoplasma haemofelis]CBY92207.1 hypothetical protein HF1_01990 [Mycoplasma haemofelis str. Langford 1]